MHAAMTAGAVVVVLLIAGVLFFRRRDTGYEVDSFERARSLTTGWARRAEGAPPAAPGASDVAGTRRDGEPRDGERPGR